MPSISVPITLAIDAATAYLALGLLTPQGDSSWRREVGRAHAEQLPGALRTLLGEAGLEPGQLQRLVIGTGPGSYTGVRVGASYALGLGRACGAPVVGVSTLESLIDPQQDGIQAVSLDARKEQLYGAVYRVGGGLVTGTLVPGAKFTRAEFAAKVGDYLWRQDAAPDALALARAGLAHGLGAWQLQYL